MNMKLIVTIFMISLTYQLAANQTLEAIQQDSSGYSTSIIHLNPQFPDQQAESSIDLHFGPNKLNQFSKQARNLYEGPYSSTHLEHLPENYPLQFALTPKENKPQDYPLEYTNNPVPQHFQNSKGSPSSQSFNVGYSVKFGGLQSPIQQVKQVKPTLLNSDIITGSHKEEVIKPPNVNPIHEEYVLNSLLDNKKQKISGIKPKYHRPVTTNVDPAKLISQANLSPKTQMKLFELQGNKEPDYENDQYLKDANTSPWKTLSPGVEIYQSKPIQAVSKEIMVDPKRFDHAKALGKSLKFDSSDILGFKPTDLETIYDTQLNVNKSPTKAYENNEDLYTTEKIKQNLEIVPIEVENDKSTAISGNVPSDSPSYSQQSTKFSSNHIHIPQQPSIELLQQKPSLRPNNINFEGNHDIPKYLNHAVRNTPHYHNINIPMQTEQNSEGNVYVVKHRNEDKHFVNPQSPSLRTNNKRNPAPVLHSNIKEVNSQLEKNFNQQLANIYKFTQQTASPTYAGYGQNLKDYYNRYGHQAPLVDLTKNALVQQSLNQPNNIARNSNHMYSVYENQTDNIGSSQLYENNKVHGKNFSNSYIPQKNFHRNNYGGAMKRRPSSRFTKDVKKYSKPHSRNKSPIRMGPFL